MYRKTVSILLVFCVLALFLTGCSGKKGEAADGTADRQTTAGEFGGGDREKSGRGDGSVEPVFSEDAGAALNSVRQAIFDEGSVCGICYLGGIDRSGGPVKEDPGYLSGLLDSTGLTEDWPFLTEIPSGQIVETELGQELYAIIPVSDDCSLSVNQWVMNEDNGYVGETGDVLYRSEVGAPILLICNFSDVFPDVQVSVVGNGAEAVFEPMRSLRDGSITMPFNVPLTDLTVYAPEQDWPEGPDAAGPDDWLEQLYAGDLMLIENSVDMWKVPENTREGTPVYTVTDLDDNGRLELISTYSHGTGMYATSQIFEISEDHKALEKCDYGPSSMSSEPELGTMSWAYYTDGSGARAYIVSDFLREDNSLTHNYKYAMWFGDGAARVRLLAYVDMYVDTGDGTDLKLKYDYYDANGKTITAMQYDKIGDTYFNATEPSFVRLVWFDLEEDEPLYDKLGSAFTAFRQSFAQG